MILQAVWRLELLVVSVADLVQCYQRALALESTPGERQATAHLALALVSYKSGNVDLAKQQLFEAVKQPEHCPRALIAMCSLAVVTQDGNLATAAIGKYVTAVFYLIAYS